jgi:hypothetical protein
MTTLGGGNTNGADREACAAVFGLYIQNISLKGVIVSGFRDLYRAANQ